MRLWSVSLQYLLFHAAPYEVIAFKVPNMEVEKSDKFFTHWCAPESPQPTLSSSAAASWQQQCRGLQSILQSCQEQHHLVHSA